MLISILNLDYQILTENFKFQVRIVNLNSEIWILGL